MALPRIGAAIALDGEREYRSALSSINTSMATLRSELRLAGAEFEGQANSVEALTRRQEVLTRLYEEQEQRCRTMTGALESATQTYGANSREAQEWQTRLNNATTELTRMSRELDQNNGYLEEARHSTEGTATSINEYGRAVNEAEEGTSTFGDVLKANLTSEAIISGVKALASALKSVGESAIETVRDTAAYADDILTMSNNTGIATDTLQELKYMEELTDVSLDQVTSSMAKQIKSMDNARKGSSDYIEAYKKLNVEFADGNGNLRDSETVYWELIDALGKMTDETERDAVSMKLFGKSAQDLNSLVKIGSEGVAEFAQEARDMGAVLSDDTLDKLGATDDAFQRIDQSMQIFKRELGIAMGPSITKSIEKVTEKITGMGTELGEAVSEGLELLTDGLVWILDNTDLIISALNGIVAGFVAFKAASVIEFAITKFKLLSVAVTNAGGVVKGLWSVISANPAMAAATAIGVLTTAIVLIATKSKESKSEVELLAEEIEQSFEKGKELRAEIDETLESINQSYTDTSAEEQKYKNMSARLSELAGAENLSNVEKAEMAYLIEELNKSFPELGLQIDEVTGKLNKQEDQVIQTIESYSNMAKVSAAKSALQQIADEEAKNQVYIAQKIKDRNEMQEKQIALQKELNDLIKYQEESKDIQAEKVYNLRSDIETTEDSIKSLNNEIEIQQGEIDKCSEAYDFALENVRSYSEGIDDTKSSTQRLVEANQNLRDRAVENFTEIKEQYEEVKTAAEDSILTQIGLFDQYNEEIKYSKEEMLANLQSQIDGMKNWSDNMDRAAELGVDEKILKQFRDMGIESAGYLEEITKMTDTEIQKMNKLYEEKLTVADTVASEMAEAETNLNDALYRMQFALTNGNLTLPVSLQPQSSTVPQQKQEISNVLSNEERERRETQNKVNQINVYVGSKQVASVVESEIKAQNSRYNPFAK